ncbi:MAG: BON domain-containing protein [Anaerolineales bacterium]|nr:BON domain-containing protein [Anaerolineales bacterium]
MRKDEQILKEIWEQLNQYGQFDPGQIRVEVDNGYVTLNGTVDSRRGKHLAQGAAMLVSGVRSIHNQLRLEPVHEEPNLPDGEDDELEDAEDHRRETAINSDYPGYDPRWVDIYSAPESTFSEYQDVAPEAGPNSTAENDPQDTAKRIAEEIHQRLCMHGQIKSAIIDIDVKGGQVTLKGTIDSSRAKQAANEIARSVEGVSQILNQLQIK